MMGNNAKKSLEELLALVQTEVTKRLNNIEERLDFISDTHDELDEKVEQLSAILNERSAACGDSTASSEDSNSQLLPLGPGVTVITLNTADDFPEGSWLGDETRPELRVRCPMTPTELFHINTTCSTAEKMALTLLDYLFDRETQACSNISGTGKHKKKKLDPLFIYGIQCHLIAHFGITAEDWFRIKQNIDSKCRTAFRRKIKGLPLFPKGGHGSPHSSENVENLTTNASNSENFENLNVASDLLSGDLSESGPSNQSGEVASIDENLLAQVLQQTDLLKTAQGEIQILTDQNEIQILRATTDQLMQIKQSHQVQLLSDGQIIALPITSSSSDSQ